MKRIEVYVKNVFGVDRIYPSNTTARELLNLIGKKTFTEQDLAALARLGYEVEQVMENKLNLTKEVK